MKTPPRTIEVKILDNKYQIEFPNTGQLLDIEILKSDLAKGKYSDMLTNSSSSGVYARFLIDAIATYTILCPNLIKDLKAPSLLELDPMDSKILLYTYINKIHPWMIEWERVLNQDLDTDDNAEETPNNME